MSLQVMQQSQPYQYQQTYRNVSPQQSSHEQPPHVTPHHTNQYSNKCSNKQNHLTSDTEDDPQNTTKYSWKTVKKEKERICHQ
jgi:hypothetical protein